MGIRTMATCLLAGCALTSAPPVTAQVADDDYGALLRRATGVDPLPEEVVREAAPPPERRQQVRSGGGTERTETRDEAVFLNRASDYASEPHRVRVVDRSRFDRTFHPTDLPNSIGLAVGDVLVDTRSRHLYVGLPGGAMRRYGVGVGSQGSAWRGTAEIGRMARWPSWHPTANQRRKNRRLPTVMRGGPTNPLGARALYLHKDGADTLYRIHGTNEPSSIGRAVSSGCIRMINEDVIDLYGLVRNGARVTVR